jgi:hypothetical protein
MIDTNPQPGAATGRGMRHPITGALYEMCAEGVRVTTAKRVGVFDSDGRWLMGDRFDVCPNLCGWIGRGPSEPTDLSQHRRFRTVTPDAASGHDQVKVNP